jgi:hypothetical protein
MDAGGSPLSQQFSLLLVYTYDIGWFSLSQHFLFGLSAVKARLAE